MTCCTEHGCRRSKPFLIRLGPFSGRWLLITDYKTTGDRDQFIEAKAKHDITDDLIAALTDAGWTPPPRPLGPLPLADPSTSG